MQLNNTEGGIDTLVGDTAKASVGMLQYEMNEERIDAQESPHIFERFYRSDRSRARDLEERVGAGISLPVSRHLAELMNGTLEVASTLGEGTVFTMSWPRKPRKEAAERSRRQRQELSLSGNGQG